MGIFLMILDLFKLANIAIPEGLMAQKKIV
jgi:hypothetical protein